MPQWRPTGRKPAAYTQWLKATYPTGSPVKTYGVAALWAQFRATRAGAAPLSTVGAGGVTAADVTTGADPVNVWEGEGGAVPGVAAPAVVATEADRGADGGAAGRSTCDETIRYVVPMPATALRGNSLEGVCTCGGTHWTKAVDEPRPGRRAEASDRIVTRWGYERTEPWRSAGERVAVRRITGDRQDVSGAEAENQGAERPAAAASDVTTEASKSTRGEASEAATDAGRAEGAPVDHPRAAAEVRPDVMLTPTGAQFDVLKAAARGELTLSRGKWRAFGAGCTTSARVMVKAGLLDGITPTDGGRDVLTRATFPKLTMPFEQVHSHRGPVFTCREVEWVNVHAGSRFVRLVCDVREVDGRWFAYPARTMLEALPEVERVAVAWTREAAVMRWDAGDTLPAAEVPEWHAVVAEVWAGREVRARLAADRRGALGVKVAGPVGPSHDSDRRPAEAAAAGEQGELSPPAIRDDVSARAADVVSDPSGVDVWEAEGGAVPGVDTPAPVVAAVAVMPIDWAKPAGRGDCAAANTCGGFGVLLWDVPGCAPRCAECAARVMGHSPAALRALTLPGDVAEAEAKPRQRTSSFGTPTKTAPPLRAPPRVTGCGKRCARWAGPTGAPRESSSAAAVTRAPTGGRSTGLQTRCAHSACRALW